MINLIVKALRVIFSMIDRLLIVIINGSYSLLLKLASFTLVDSNTVRAFNQRIGLLLGIFMLFSLAIQLLNYIISPDKFSDKSKGGGKMVTNVVLSLFLLATVNFIFEFAYQAQFKILQKQIIPQIIFGVRQDEDNLSKQTQEISYYLFSTFVTVNQDATGSDQPLCNNIYSSNDDKCNDYLMSVLNDDDFNSFKLGLKDKDASRLLNVGNITAMYNNEFVFDYMFLFSTVISVIVILILLGFCLDVSVRVVKLYFYQIIAPIPIIANMIPGKGEESFKKWYKACFTTYLDVFIRLIALFFATYIISLAWSSLKSSLSGHFLLGIFIILGALMFAKQVPQIVQDLTGLKLDGSFSLNPLKKLNDNPFIGGLAGGLAGSALGALNSGKAAGAVGKNRFLYGMQGLFTGGARGMMQGSREKDLHGAFRKGADYSTVGAKKILAGKDTTFGGRNLAKIQKRARMKTEDDLIEEQLGSYGKASGAIASIKSSSEAFVDKKAAMFTGASGQGYMFFDSKGQYQSFKNLSELRAYYESMKSKDTSQMSPVEMKAHAAEVSDLEKHYFDARKQATEQHISEVLLGKGDTANDEDTRAAIEEFKKIKSDDESYYNDPALGIPDLNIDDKAPMFGKGSAAQDLLDAKDKITAKKTEIDSSEKTRRARANAKYAEETRSPRPGPMGPLPPGGKKP